MRRSILYTGTASHFSDDVPYYFILMWLGAPESSENGCVIIEDSAAVGIMREGKGNNEP